MRSKGPAVLLHGLDNRGKKKSKANADFVPGPSSSTPSADSRTFTIGNTSYRLRPSVTLNTNPLSAPSASNVGADTTVVPMSSSSANVAPRSDVGGKSLAKITKPKSSSYDSSGSSDDEESNPGSLSRLPSISGSLGFVDNGDGFLVDKSVVGDQAAAAAAAKVPTPSTPGSPLALHGGDGNTQGDGDTNAQGDGDANAQGDGDGNAQGDGDGNAQGDGDANAQGDGDANAQGDGDANAQGDGDAIGQGGGHGPRHRRGGHGSGRGGRMSARHKNKTKKQGMENLTKEAIKKLARRGGVTRISGLVYEPVRDSIETYLKMLDKLSIVFMESQKKKVVQVTHVLEALKRMDRTHYSLH